MNMKDTLENRKIKINDCFREWYFDQPYGQVRGIRAEIIKRCDISTYKFSNWLQGKSTPSFKERKIINRIAGTNIF